MIAVLGNVLESPRLVRYIEQGPFFSVLLEAMHKARLGALEGKHVSSKSSSTRVKEIRAGRKKENTVVSYPMRGH